jgi:hypothetical protein
MVKATSFQTKATIDVAKSDMLNATSKLIEALRNKPLDVEIKQLVGRFGEDAVKAAVKRVARPKIGRKPEPDDQLLQGVWAIDTADILAGRVPFQTSDYGATVAIAKEHKGHNEVATQKRLQRKLSQMRRPLAYYDAITQGRKSVPHADYLAMIRQAIEGVECAKESNYQKVVAELLSSNLQEYESLLAQYFNKNGSKPLDSMTFEQIYLENRPSLFGLASSAKKGGIGGLFGQFK